MSSGLISPLTVVVAGLVWVLVLFAVALYGERRADRFGRAWPAIYALSLAVYCTAWTFYGTVTQAARWGVGVPPTFVGTIVLFALALPFLRRLAALVREHNAATLADLIAARFGKDSRLAATVTGVAVLGMVPYVALQLKAVAMSYAMLTGDPATGPIADAPAWRDAALWVAVVMAAFAMLFGTRRAAATEHNRGLVLAMGFESLFKLAAMLAVGAFAAYGLNDGVVALARAAAHTTPLRIDGGFVALVGLGALAMFTLPHQFHIGIVELRDDAHLRTARWLFPLYLILIALPILPLAWAGRLGLDASVPSDLYVLGLPLAAGHDALALFAFLGGLSAATGMVILAALTLSLMVANHWIAPWLVRGATAGVGAERAGDLRPTVLGHRRIAIAVVIALAWAYSRAMAASDVLADIGALSFSALAQLAPAVVAAVYAPHVGARAVLAGLVAGALAWLALVLVPTVAPDLSFGGSPLAGGTLASLALNVGVLALYARRAAAPEVPRAAIDSTLLRELAARFLAPEHVAVLFDEPTHDVDARVARVERELAAVIGAASARLLVDAARQGRGAALDDVAELVGEARFNERLLEAALENMSQGISVVDAELRLVAWNRRYAALFDYPPELLRVGVPVDALVRHNARRGLIGADEVGKRLAHMRAGTPYVTERAFPDGSVVEIRGNPMPGGGFVATFTDVTAFRRTEAELKAFAGTLEDRVAERTAALEAARADAERANQAKTRFLAAVSHDLLQPINAAHLFAHALDQRLEAEPDRGRPYREAVQHIDGALTSAEGLLAELLDISRLDAGGMPVRVQAFALADWLAHLAAEFRVLAAERGLALELVPARTRAWIRTDPQLLRRVLQNFLANAVRYTARGRIVLGLRRRGGGLALEVWDTGPGIAPADQATIFEEFRRLDRGGPGLGLGLAIAERIARLLGHRLELASTPGRGTVFRIVVPRAAPEHAAGVPGEPRVAAAAASRVLVVDNDAAVLKGMESLLAGWGCRVLAARTADEALAHVAAARPDLLLIDYHLDGGLTGLALRERLGAVHGDVPTVVITADHSEPVRRAVAAAGGHLLHKPLKPLALKSLMARLLAARAA